MGASLGAFMKHPEISGELYGCFLKWWYPQNTPKWSFFLVGKPMVVGCHHFRKPPIICLLLAGDGAHLVQMVFVTFEDDGNDVTIYFSCMPVWNVDSLMGEGRNNTNTQPLVTKFPPTVAGKDGFTLFPEGWDS